MIIEECSSLYKSIGDWVPMLTRAAVPIHLENNSRSLNKLVHYSVWRLKELLQFM